MPGMIQNSPGPRRPVYFPSRRTTARSHCCAIWGDIAATHPWVHPAAIAHRLLCHPAATPNPRPTPAISRRYEMMFNRVRPTRPRDPFRPSAILDRLAIGLPPFPVDPAHFQEADRFLRREPQRGGAGQEAIRQLPEQPLAIRRGRVASPARPDERPHPSPRLEHAGALQLGVDL